jgi:Flp pilus assembly pilin Flp
MFHPRDSERGASTVEYALLIAVIILGIVGAAKFMIPGLQTFFKDVVVKVQTLSGEQKNTGSGAPSRTVPASVVPPPRTVEPPITVAPPVAAPPKTPNTSGTGSQFTGPSQEEQKGILDAFKHFSQGDSTALADLMKYTKNIPEGGFVFIQGSGGVGFGVSGAQVKLDFLSAGLKAKKNHDGSVEIEVAGQLGLKPGAEGAVGVDGDVGLRAGAYVKIPKDGQRITFGQKAGVGGSGEGSVKTPGVGVFGKYGVDGSAMVGWKVEMPVETYNKLSLFERSWLTSPASAGFLAYMHEDIGLYLTGDVNLSHGGSTGVHGGGGWGPQGGFEGGVGWEDDVYDNSNSIKVLWYFEDGKILPYSLILAKIDYINQPKVTA